jgi:hypothetical protein
MNMLIIHKPLPEHSIFAFYKSHPRPASPTAKLYSPLSTSHFLNSVVEHPFEPLAISIISLCKYSLSNHFRGIKFLVLGEHRKSVLLIVIDEWFLVPEFSALHFVSLMIMARFETF